MSGGRKVDETKTNTILDYVKHFTPELRVVVAVGYFGLSFLLIHAIIAKPELLDKGVFVSITTLIIGTGGLGAIASFLFGGTQAGVEVMKKQSETLTKGTG